MLTLNTPSTRVAARLLGKSLPTAAERDARRLIAEYRSCYQERLAVALDESQPARRRLTYLAMTASALGWLNQALQANGLPPEPAPVLPTARELVAAA